MWVSPIARGLSGSIHTSHAGVVYLSNIEKRILNEKHIQICTVCSNEKRLHATKDNEIKNRY